MRPAITPMPVSETEPLTATVRETIKLTGLSQSFLYELMKEGKLSYVHVAGRRLVHYSSIKRLVGLDGASSAAA